MSRAVTFVLIGKRRGASIDIGPSGRYKFRNGELKVPEHDVSAMATALSHYAAYPKGDAEPFHLAACQKLGIHPETLATLPTQPEVVVEAVTDPDKIKKMVSEFLEDAPEPSADDLAEAQAQAQVADAVPLSDQAPLTGSALEEAILAIVAKADPADDACWTGTGTISVFWVNEQLPSEIGASRKLIDPFNVTRETLT